VEQHFGVAADNVVIIEDGEVDEGEDEDIDLYREFLAFSDKDLSDPKEWAAFEESVDVDSMLDYFATQIYVGNADWRPDKNVRIWRSREVGENPYADGRWRFMLYDIEYSSGLYGFEEDDASHDHLTDALVNFPVFAAAMENDGFRARFVERIDQIGSENYSPERVVSLFGDYDEEWQPLMADCRNRFGLVPQMWDWQRDETVAFFGKRHDAIMAYVKAYDEARR
jgi:hypothetical protein